MAELIQRARADTNGSRLILLDRLKGDAETITQGTL
jgi:hypothetical protein